MSVITICIVADSDIKRSLKLFETQFTLRSKKGHVMTQTANPGPTAPPIVQQPFERLLIQKRTPDGVEITGIIPPPAEEGKLIECAWKRTSLDGYGPVYEATGDLISLREGGTLFTGERAIIVKDKSTLVLGGTYRYELSAICNGIRSTTETLNVKIKKPMSLKSKLAIALVVGLVIGACCYFGFGNPFGKPNPRTSTATTQPNDSAILQKLDDMKSSIEEAVKKATTQSTTQASEAADRAYKNAQSAEQSAGRAETSAKKAETTANQVREALKAAATQPSTRPTSEPFEDHSPRKRIEPGIALADDAPKMQQVPCLVAAGKDGYRHIWWPAIDGSVSHRATQYDIYNLVAPPTTELTKHFHTVQNSNGFWERISDTDTVNTDLLVRSTKATLEKHSDGSYKFVVEASASGTEVKHGILCFEYGPTKETVTTFKLEPAWYVVTSDDTPGIRKQISAMMGKVEVKEATKEKSPVPATLPIQPPPEDASTPLRTIRSGTPTLNEVPQRGYHWLN
jgi:hypothetical protein